MMAEACADWTLKTLNAEIMPLIVPRRPRSGAIVTPEMEWILYSPKACIALPRAAIVQAFALTRDFNLTKPFL